MLQKLQTNDDSGLAPGPPGNREPLSSRLIDELRRAIAPVAESADVAAALITTAQVTWLTKPRSCSCATQAADLSACPEPPCLDGRGLLTSQMLCDGEYIGDLAICNPIEQPYLAGVIEYLARIAAGRIAQERREASLLEELRASSESLEAVYESSRDLRTLQNPGELLDRIVSRSAAVADDLCAALWLEQDGVLHPTAMKNAAGLQPKTGGNSLLRRSMAGGSPLVINDRECISESHRDDPELRLAQSVALVPMKTRQGLSGALAVWTEGHRDFDSRSLRLLQTLALQAAMVIENECLHRTAIASERLRQQIEIGSKIQQSLLVGQMPEGVRGLKVFVFTLPSQEIDGDFYDFIKHSNECLDVLVGDVMGKGIPAALLGAATKNSFLRATSRVSLAAGRAGVLASPEEIVNFVHQDMTRQLIELDNFATACYARFDVDAQQVEIVDCGHTRTIRYWQRTGLCGVLAGNNMPLGFSEGEIYKQFSVPLEPGDVFLFYSDGVTEARNRDGEMFGEERLVRCVHDYSHLQPQPLIDAIRRDVMAFANVERFSDDFTLLAVKVAGGQSEVIREALEITSELAELKRARAFICSLCDKAAFLRLTEETVSHLQLAVTEALSNIIRHAYRGRSGQPIEIEATADAHHIGLRLCHRGEIFDPKSASPPPLDGSREGGLGLYIIEQLVDELSYSRDEHGRACTYLVKRFH